METNNLFYIDIETAGAYSSIDDMLYEYNDTHSYECWKKRCDKKSHTDEDYAKVAPLLAEYGRIVCISLGFEHNGEFRLHSIVGDDEHSMLLELKSILDKLNTYKLCGFNIKNFDIPFLWKKFLSFDIIPPKCVNILGKKPWEIDMIDLAEIWKGTSMTYATFDEMANSLDVDSPKDEMDGSEVHFLYHYKENHEDNLNKIKEYCEKDVKCLYDCVNKLKNLI